jgi:hypothetical protein
MRRIALPAALSLSMIFAGCGSAPEEEPASMNYQNELNKYVSFRLTSDLSVLTEKERQMLPLLVEAAQAMDGLFWRQAYGDRDALLASITDPAAKQLVEINYGPWDRLADNAPLIPAWGRSRRAQSFIRTT